MYRMYVLSLLATFKKYCLKAQNLMYLRISFLSKYYGPLHNPSLANQEQNVSDSSEEIKEEIFRFENIVTIKYIILPSLLL